MINDLKAKIHHLFIVIALSGIISISPPLSPASALVDPPKRVRSASDFATLAYKYAPIFIQQVNLKRMKNPVRSEYNDAARREDLFLRMGFDHDDDLRNSSKSAARDNSRLDLSPYV